jgi:glycine betaine monooxygenase A
MKEVSRRDFTWTTVAAGAAAAGVGLPASFVGETATVKLDETKSTFAAGAAAARRRVVVPSDIVSYDVRRMKDLWEITYLEDKWLAENNHLGIESTGYSESPYAAVETGPRRFVEWYMTEMVPAEPTNAG